MEGIVELLQDTDAKLLDVDFSMFAFISDLFLERLAESPW